MTKERKKRIEEIAKAITDFRSELNSMRLEEIHELSSIKDSNKYFASTEHITELREASECLADGLEKIWY